ncbi:hypothetical protein ACMGDM_16495 [Sphingomonas sp. DT-51]|uniref:hypothetical protein n=1 Tax=Sphingomonas sp. DT-51 TaxID=3396165 RepID=UPI003F1BF342
MRSIKSHGTRGRQSREQGSLDLTALLRPGPKNVQWEADKAGWRAFVFGNTMSGFPAGNRLDRAWRRGYEAGQRSDNAAGLML